MRRTEKRLRVWPGVLVALATLAAIMPPPVPAVGSVLHGFCLVAGFPVFLLFWAAFRFFADRTPFLRHLFAFAGSIALVLAVTAAGSRFGPGNLLAAPLVGSAGIGIWWIASSRAAAWERVSVTMAFGAAMLVAWLVSHPSMPLVLLVYGLPTVLAAGVVSLALCASRSPAKRGAGFVAAIVLASGAWSLVRCDGVDGFVKPLFSWRWSPTAEEEFLALLPADSPPGSTAVGSPPGAADARPVPGDWPEFRGPNRDGRVEKAAFRVDWDEHPPREVWRRAVGPGWSSFSRVGNHLFTQEQRGDYEHVVCYDAETGEEVWSHGDEARFYEVMGGVGPRGTPTYHQGNLFSQGAMGTLNCLDAATGFPHWSRDVVADSGSNVPTWGFAGSPLVVDGRVVVYAGGEGENGVLAYDARTGEPAWRAPAGGLSYSSPHLWRLDGASQVLMLSNEGLISLAAENGEPLWSHSWQWKDNARIVQPHIVEPNRVLLGSGVGFGTRMLDVRRVDSEWRHTEIWTSQKLKPVFNDFVTHKGSVYGFDGRILTSLDLETGARNWKGGRYGTGQLLLLASMDLLVVLSERGEIVLVDGDPTEHRERVRFQALQGKTWNHPVFSRGRLYVRNAQEAACFDLAAEDPSIGVERVEIE